MLLAKQIHVAMAQFFSNLLSLCKRRGFILELPKRCNRQQAEHKYGPLGAELKRNLVNEWWHAMVTSTGNIHGISSNTCTSHSTEESTVRSSKTSSETINSASMLCMVETAKCLRLKPPYGTAEISKMFREDRYSLLNSPEIECMCVHFLCPPVEERRWLSHWQKKRLRWWRKLSRNPEKFSLGEGDTHNGGTKQQCSIQYEFPWGSQDIESIKNRGDQDFKQLAEADGSVLRNFAEGVCPSLISIVSGVDRAVLAHLCDAYSEVDRPRASHDREEQSLTTLTKILKLHISLAPYKVAVLPTVDTNSKLCMYSRLLSEELKHTGISTVYCENGPLASRLTLQDEVGTPYRVITDEGTLETGIVTLQDRDTTGEEDMNGRDVLPSVQRMLFGAKTN